MEYKKDEKTGLVKKYVRAGTGYFRNSETPSITFVEDAVLVLPDGQKIVTEGVSTVTGTLAKPGTPFDLLNPATDDVIGTADYQQVFVTLYSLHRHLALIRDSAPT